MMGFVLKNTENDIISIRIDLELLARIDREANEAKISRNQVIVQCISYALEHLTRESQ